LKATTGFDLMSFAPQKTARRRVDGNIKKLLSFGSRKHVNGLKTPLGVSFHWLLLYV